MECIGNQIQQPKEVGIDKEELAVWQIGQQDGHLPSMESIVMNDQLQQTEQQKYLQMHHDFQSLKEKYDDLFAQERALRQEFHNQRGRLEQRNAEVGALRHQNEAILQEKFQIEVKNDRLKRDLDQARQSSGFPSGGPIQQSESVLQIQSKLDRAERALESERATVLSLYNKLENSRIAQQSGEDACRQVSILTNQLQVANSELLERVERAEKADQQVATLRKELLDVTNSARAQLDEQRRVEACCRELRELNARLNVDLHTLASVHERDQKAALGSREEAQNIQVIAREKQAQVASLTVNVDKLVAENSDLVEQLNHSRGQLQQAISQVMEIRSQVGTQNADLAQARAQLALAENAAEQSEQLLVNMKGRVDAGESMRTQCVKAELLCSKWRAIQDMTTCIVEQLQSQVQDIQEGNSQTQRNKVQSQQETISELATVVDKGRCLSEQVSQLFIQILNDMQIPNSYKQQSVDRSGQCNNMQLDNNSTNQQQAQGGVHCSDEQTSSQCQTQGQDLDSTTMGNAQQNESSRLDSYGGNLNITCETGGAHLREEQQSISQNQHKDGLDTTTYQSEQCDHQQDGIADQGKNTQIENKTKPDLIVEPKGAPQSNDEQTYIDKDLGVQLVKQREHWGNRIVNFIVGAPGSAIQ